MIIAILVLQLITIAGLVALGWILRGVAVANLDDIARARLEANDRAILDRRFTPGHGFEKEST